ncbi:P-selectin [Ixodes scapularis]
MSGVPLSRLPLVEFSREGWMCATRPLGQIRLGGNEWSRCINGTWSSEVPYCYEPGKFEVVIHLKDTAGTALSPDGYLNIDPRFEVEMECESYYYHPRLEMMEPLSSWKRGEEQTCDVNNFLSRVPPEVVIEANASEVAAGTVYHAFCKNTGYIFDGRSRVVCNADGKWAFDPSMRCNRSCAIPPLAPGVNIVRRTAAEMRFACQRNLALEGPEQIHCSRTGEWDAKPPLCVQLQTTPAPGCDVTDFLIAVPDPVVINASDSEVALGAVFEAFCNYEGYILEGRSHVTCKANGMWDFDPKMTCIPSCANPSLAPGVNVVRRTAAEMRFACQSNLALEGPEQIHCSRTGEWDAKPPVCVQPQTPLIFLPTTEEQTCNVNNFKSRVPPEVVIEENAPEAAAGTVYHAFCKNTDHMFNGQSRVFCNADGTWSFDARMSCVKGCPNFADQDESLIIEGILPTYQLGDSITLSCPGGTELDPPVERITCLGDRWSETKLPHCLDRFPFRF